MADWISTKERLPERDETVLTWDRMGHTSIQGGPKFGLLWMSDCYYEVTHWMPLPDGPADSAPEAHPAR